MIRASLQDAVVDGLLAENPARNLRLAHRYRPRFTPLTGEEAKALLKAARGDHRLNALYAVALVPKSKAGRRSVPLPSFVTQVQTVDWLSHRQ